MTTATLRTVSVCISGLQMCRAKHDDCDEPADKWVAQQADDGAGEPLDDQKWWSPAVVAMLESQLYCMQFRSVDHANDLLDWVKEREDELCTREGWQLFWNEFKEMEWSAAMQTSWKV